MQRDQQQLAFPRPQRGVKALLVVYGAVGLVAAILINYAPSLGNPLWTWLACYPALVLHRAWTLVTAGLLADPDHWSQWLFALVGIYFLGPDLERRWGTWRLLRFVAISTVAGFALSIAVGAITPAETRFFHPRMMFGSAAMLAALAVAWGRENADMQIRLYMILPISGRWLVWITLGFCALGVFFPGSVTEGVVSPFGGFIAGMLLAGSPSPLRALYLRVKLAFLRRGRGPVSLDLDEGPRPTRKRAGSPPLRVVVGGLDEDLEKRRTPKDKRYLN